MKRKMKFRICLLLFGLLTLTPLFIIQIPQTTYSQEPKPVTIKIAHLSDWTGPLGRTLGPVGDGFISYFHNEINKEKGGIPYLDLKTGKIKGKVNIEVLYADCRYELPLFKSAYRDFASKGVVAFSSGASPAIEGLKKDYKEDKIPCIQATSNTVGYWPPEWVYGLRPSLADDSGVYIDWILENWKEKRPPRVAMMYQDGAYGRSMLWGFPQYAKSKGCEIVADEPVPSMPQDTTAQLLRIKQANADFIAMNMVGSQIAVVLKDMKRLGIKIPAGTNTGTDAGELVTLAGDVAEGFYYTWPGPAYAFWDESASPVKWVNEHYRKYFKGKSGYDVVKRPHPEGVWQLGWAAAIVTGEAIRLALEKVPPEELSGEKLKLYGIDRMKNFDCYGFRKELTYYPGVDHRGSSYTIIHQVKNLKDSILTDWRKAPCLIPDWGQKK